MSHTNQHNMPTLLVKAIEAFVYPTLGPNEVSVTELEGPIRIAVLKRRYGDQVVEDVSDKLWALLGSATHAAIEKAEKMASLQVRGVTNVLSEERLGYLFLNGWTLVGHFDHWMKGKLTDFKVTSVWSFILGDKPEWAYQLNDYAMMFHEYGYEVTALEIVAILRDWNKRQSLQNEDYPPAPFQVKKIRLAPFVETRSRLEARIKLFVEQLATGDDMLVPCTAEERWAKDDVWAVKKRGNKRAVPGGLFKNEDDAIACVGDENTTFEIEYRKGEDTRCLNYCPVNKWCSYWKKNYGSEAA